MEVILIKPVRNLGKIGEIISVKNGFGRNYLLPNQVAIRATEANKQLLASQKHDFEEKNVQAKLMAEETVSAINNKIVVFIKQSSEDGRLFGSVNTKEIASELTKVASQDIHHSNIILTTPIRTTGTFQVEVSLHAEIGASISVIVARSKFEAQEAMTALLPKEKVAMASENVSTEPPAA